MQPVSPRVVELLNDALTFELTVTNTYFLHARMLDNWGLTLLGKVYYDLSIDEMKDADAIINRILLFDGHPNVQRLNNIQVGETPEEMLRLALESERVAVAQFNGAAQECHDLGDHGTAAVFEQMVLDEERHADWFEGQLDALERVGPQQYLAQQIDAGAGPAQGVVTIPGSAGDIGGELVNYIGLEFVELTRDKVVATWTGGPHLHQPHGIVHGGAHCSVVETLASMGASVWLGEQGTVVGVNNNTDFYRAVTEGGLTSTAIPLHRGRSQQVWLVETVIDATGKLASRGQVRLQNLYPPA